MFWSLVGANGLTRSAEFLLPNAIQSHSGDHMGQNITLFKFELHVFGFSKSQDWKKNQYPSKGFKRIYFVVVIVA